MTANEFLSEAKSIENEIINIRRTLHGFAEIGFDLTKTKDFVYNKLCQMGYKPKYCGKAGIVATVGNGGRVFMLRADMDALPIREETDVPFACTEGRMHACGHDMHTAMLLGAAKLLKSHESELWGTVKLMFQPAEEILEGAQDMIDAGVLNDPAVDAAMMIHVMAGVQLTAGTVIVSSPGVSAPAADHFKIRVYGKGCHGSTPYEGIDALTAAAHILIGLQEIAARELGASDEAMLTVGKMNGGTAGNAIADTAVMEGTLRAFDEDIREMIKKRIAEISNHIAAAFRARADITFGSGCPSLLNDADISATVGKHTIELLGKNAVFTTAELNGGKNSRGGGSEDFAYVSRKVPSVMIALAAGEPRNGYEHTGHNPKVKYDETVLAVGCAVYAWNAMKWLDDK